MASQKKNKKGSPQHLRIVVLGGPNVGKSALAVRYITKRYIGEYTHDGERTYRNDITIDGEPITLEILDTNTGGVEVLPTQDQLEWADGAVLIYSVTDRRSFDHIKKIREAIPADKFFTLLGNKCDMIHQRQISYEEGEILAKDFDCKFFEVTAAEEMTHISDGFEQVGREIIAARRKHKLNNLFNRVLGGRSSHRAQEDRYPLLHERQRRRLLCWPPSAPPDSDSSSD